MGLRSPSRNDLARAAKLLVFCAGAVLIVPATTNVGSVADFPSWWTTPIAIQKLVVWTLLWLVASVGNEFRKSARAFDAALYLAVLLVGIGLLRAGTTHGEPFDTLPRAGVWGLLGCLVVLGLRNKAIRALHPELFAMLLLVFAFDTANMVFALKLAVVGTWCAAATGRLRWPAAPATYAWSVGVYALALVLLFARGGALSWVAVALALAAQAYAALVLRALEIGAFLGFATVYLFGHYADVGGATLTSATLPVLLALALAGLLIGPVGRAIPKRNARADRALAVRPAPAPRPTPAARPKPYRPRPQPRPGPSPGIIGT